MKWVRVLLIVALMMSVFSIRVVTADEKKNVAVLDLETRGATTAAEAKALTDRLRSILVRTNAFNVVDRGKMEAILQEVGFQQSGCTSTECAVEVGRILNVKQMVSGSIGKIGSMYTIDIAAIDVESSAILKSFSRDYKGEIEGLIGIMSEIANQLAGGSAGKQGGDIGSLLLTSNPESAKVFLDNKPIGKTPLKVDELEAGDHKLKVLADGYKDSEGTIEVKKGVVNKYNITMKKKGGKKWLLLGTTTVAVAGGTAAYVLLNQKKDDSGTQTGSFPAPPGRP
ncbi:PEGA domain-containing protein [candidate division KSB1 bacterium]|nr:PEGA domain-containing protein [candidate division KSB1 bacterium]